MAATQINFHKQTNDTMNTMHKIIAALVYITIGLALISFCKNPDDGHYEPQNQNYTQPEDFRYEH